MTDTPPNSPSLSPSSASYLINRNVMIYGVRTSMRLEPEVWAGLIEICYRERMTVHEACTVMKEGCTATQSLSSAVRMHVLGYFRRAATPEGHRLAHHGRGASAIRSALLPGSACEDRFVGSNNTAMDSLQHGRDAVRDAKLPQDILGVKLDAPVGDSE